MVDALGRYRCPPGWPRAAGEPTDSGAVYYCRYFELAEGVEHMDAPILNPRGDLGYMGFNVFRGDNRTFAVILLAPSADRELRVLRHDDAWRVTCAAITPLDVMTSAEYGRPITEVMPMGGLMNVDRTGDPGGLGNRGGRGMPSATPTPRSRAACRSRSPTPRTWPWRPARRRTPTRSPSATARSPGPRRGRGMRWPAPPTQHARGVGAASRSTSPGATAATRCSRSPARSRQRPTTTTSSAGPSRRIGLLDRTAIFDEDEAVHERIEAILAESRSAACAGPAARRAAGSHFQSRTLSRSVTSPGRR